MPRPQLPPDKNCDVLVLGGGLAGWRAAMAALQAPQKKSFRPLKVMLATREDAPSGASFANRNRVLGMQVLKTDAAAMTFAARAAAIAAPGWIDPRLVEQLAAASLSRFEELHSLGLRFRSSVAGCFCPELATAVILEDLPGAYATLRDHCLRLGLDYQPGWNVADLLVDQQGAVTGALLANTRDNHPCVVSSKAVILALGGPAPLFRNNVTGPGNSGHGYGLLRRAGARLANTGFLQWMWHEAPSGPFFPLQNLGTDAALILPQGEKLPLPPEIQALAAARGAHCPFGYGFDDSRLDLFLSAHLDEAGAVCVESAGQQRRIAPMAHAGNGGAVVDSQGRTSVPGLFACGECATGMHGANRIGGAMVLATQVFGEAAGRAAAGHAFSLDRPNRQLPLGVGTFSLSAAPSHSDQLLREWLHNAMQRHVSLGGFYNFQQFYAELCEIAQKEYHWALNLDVQSALVVAEGLTSTTVASTGATKDP